jgi:hypothetical protein
MSARTSVSRFRRFTRFSGIVAAAALATTALTTDMASTAAATPTRRCAIVDVPEYASNVPVKTLAPYESLTVTPGGSIWAGVWFTGENGPAGWNSYAPSGFPVPGVRTYSLLGAFGDEPYRYVGANNYTFYNARPYSRTVWARVNDNVPGNGSGAFTLQFCYWA